MVTFSVYEALQHAHALLTAGKHHEAWQAALRVLDASPDEPMAYVIAAVAGGAGQGPAYQVKVLEEARGRISADPLILYNLALSHQQCGDTLLAVLRYRDALRVTPQAHDARWNLAELLRLNGSFSEAIDHLKVLLDAGIECESIFHRIGVCYAGIGEYEESIRYFVRELRSPSNRAVTMWELSHVLLKTGRFEEGWAAYDYRFSAPEVINVSRQKYPFAQWAGYSLRNSSILIHGEQGLGDEIMFSSTFPELIAQASHVTIACHPALSDLFARSFPRARVVPHVAGGSPFCARGTEYDYQISMGSIPRYTRRTADAYNQVVHPYLDADPVACNRFEQEIRQRMPRTNSAVRIGVAWASRAGIAGSRTAIRSYEKSLPVRYLEMLADVPGITFISLQTADAAAEAALAPRLDIVDFSSRLVTLADTAALISRLNLVITIDTCVAHLACALGKPTWILLKRDCDWRWGTAGSETPWYPSARLFRQTVSGEWTAVMCEVRSALTGIVAQAQP